MYHTSLLLVPMAAVTLLMLSTACQTAPTAHDRGSVRYIQIRDSVTPTQLYATVGDEIRWQNLRPETIKVGLLDARWLEEASCANGFRRFGVIEDEATIKPREFASLCFSKATVIRYNVWLDAGDPRGRMTGTSTIWIRDPGR